MSDVTWQEAEPAEPVELDVHRLGEIHRPNPSPSDTPEEHTPLADDPPG